MLKLGVLFRLCWVLNVISSTRLLIWHRNPIPLCCWDGFLHDRRFWIPKQCWIYLSLLAHLVNLKQRNFLKDILFEFEWEAIHKVKYLHKHLWPTTQGKRKILLSFSTCELVSTNGRCWCILQMLTVWKAFPGGQFQALGNRYLSFCPGELLKDGSWIYHIMSLGRSAVTTSECPSIWEETAIIQCVGRSIGLTATWTIHYAVIIDEHSPHECSVKYVSWIRGRILQLGSLLRHVQWKTLPVVPSEINSVVEKKHRTR